ncbi:multiubiquitin domain-containing protein [Cupriavidus basilensis]
MRLDETFDLRGRGAERFVAFQTDRDFKLMLNGRQLIWGHAKIDAAVLYELSDAGPDEAVFLEVRGGEDQPIEPGMTFNLDAPGVEHFITAARPVKGYVIVVNSRDETVPNERVTFEQVVHLAFPGAPADANVRFSMTYRNAASKPHAGELGEGGSIEVKKQGTIFNVTRTVQS